VLVALAGAATARADVATTRIEGGIDADPADWPFLVGVLRHGVPDPFTAQGCAGSVVGPAAVLTAAHCVTTPRGATLHAPGLEVLVGAGALRRGEGQRVRVAEIHVHPAWSRRRGTGDAAVLVLASTVTAPAVRLPLPAEPGLDVPGGWVRMAGWGATGEAGPFPRELQELRYKVQGRSWCARGSDGSVRYDHRLNLCAEDRNDERGACAGDSGGPLVALDAARLPVLVGLVSYGPADCGTAADVYTRLRSIGPWVEAHAVRPPPPAVVPATPVVRLRGDRRAGMALRCAVVGRDPQRAHYLYQWLRNGRPIGGAVAPRLVTSRRDVGDAVRCRVTASATGGDVVGVSRAVTIRPAASARR
jgi:secreted trypsin-like serine protease